jgi:hypothetical protein
MREGEEKESRRRRVKKAVVEEGKEKERIRSRR